jgi:hypothetical protein
MRFLSELKTIRFLRMSYLSDTLTIGVLLVLLFGAISLYLYTRIQQAEQKIHLLESILLDLKMSTEIKSYTELPADHDELAASMSATMASSAIFHTPESDSHYVALDDAPAEPITEYTSLDEATQPSVHAVDNTASEAAASEENTVITLDEAESQAASSVTYESMTLKDLQSLARTRGITGAGSMKKGSIIEALKTSDRSTVIKPGSSGTVGANSFLETSALVSDGSV